MALNKLTENLKGKVAGATEFLSDLKDESKEKLLAYVNGPGEILPIIAETGYRLESIDMEVSIPPGMNIQVQKVPDVPKESFSFRMVGPCRACGHNVFVR